MLAAEVTALASLAVLPGGSGPQVAALACIAAGAASRALPVLVALLRGDAVSRVGLGAWFAERVSAVDGVVASLTAAIVAVIAGLLVGAVAFGAGIAAGAALGLGTGLFLVRTRRQVDGDVLGATVELGFAAVVGAVAIAMAMTWPAP